jgi:hypothetical protein
MTLRGRFQIRVEFAGLFDFVAYRESRTRLESVRSWFPSLVNHSSFLISYAFKIISYFNVYCLFFHLLELKGYHGNVPHFPSLCLTAPRDQGEIPTTLLFVA